MEPRTCVARVPGAGVEKFPLSPESAKERARVLSDALCPEARLRLLVGLHPPGRPIPEERMLPDDDDDDPADLAATREAAKRLAAAGEIRMVRSTVDGRVYWLRPGNGASEDD